MSRRAVRFWAVACLLLCGITAGSAVWAAAHTPPAPWYAAADEALRGLEAHAPDDPKVQQLRAEFDRLRRMFP